ncbi:hypothetical protein [Longimicrobium sp.]|jgi:hypothetical protein|uniref:hypothetical protein n=1 Tax=Longimicrobium sp. TaxID=2029185 RepID=UPI002EDAD9A8
MNESGAAGVDAGGPAFRVRASRRRSGAARHNLPIKFGLTWTDEAGNTYTLVGWRTNATGGATCYYRRD